jgi:hypothetical protein
MITANKAKSPVFKVDLNAEDMRLLLTKQKEAWLANEYRITRHESTAWID